jgi:RNA polymerase sigma-70 factor (ECF subfamily)
MSAGWVDPEFSPGIELCQPFKGIIVTKTAVEYRVPSVPSEGRRLQFIAFDAAYLERLQRGDVATERHFAAYFGELIRIKLRSRLRSKETIEDVRQETFVRVFALIRAKDGIRQPERLGALVNSVCNHVLLETYRSNKRVTSSLDDEPDREFVADEISSLGQIEIDETERVVRKILGEMPERERRLLQAVLLEERDKDEVCAELGLSREYLRVLVHRAKQSFKSFYLKRLGEVRS